jgi:hypothetical protein
LVTKLAKPTDEELLATFLNAGRKLKYYLSIIERYCTAINNDVVDKSTARKLFNSKFRRHFHKAHPYIALAQDAEKSAYEQFAQVVWKWNLRQRPIAFHRGAVSAFVDAARADSPAQWTTPRAPGKWSPGQVTEHVALAYEQSDRMLHGTFTGSAKPWYQQLLARWLGLPPLLRSPLPRSWRAWKRRRTISKELSPRLPTPGE